MNPYQPSTDGNCPHCGQMVNFKESYSRIGANSWRDQNWMVATGPSEFVRAISSVCPSCNKPIIWYEIGQGAKVHSERLGHPIQGSKVAPSDVPPEIAKDYEEAAVVLSFSEKASAALSRRCLQNILHEQGVRERNLSLEIEAVLPVLPSHISENLDAIRSVGNFAAHPIKETHTGTIVEVETGEAEWTLEVLEMLFDHYYVKPAIAQKKRDDLNEKLALAGKPPLKEP
ncbi:hypothetical protein ES703_77155 [subsurface metagenome]